VEREVFENPALSAQFCYEPLKMFLYWVSVVWLTLEIPATQETEVGESVSEDGPQQKQKILSEK
jgi:hypothetical protein